MQEQWNHKIFGINEKKFEGLSLEIFRFQYANNPIYRDYVDNIKVNPLFVNEIEQIPFLPIRLFKTQEVKTTHFAPEIIFESSGTTGTANSRHFIKEVALYEESFMKGFQRCYGRAEGYCIIGLLPSYLERQHSSLVYMVDRLIKRSSHPDSGFYLDEFEKLEATLIALEQKGQKTILIGVTFALLDFAEKFSVKLNHTIIMETGGMKGRRAEIIRPELHHILQKAFGLDAIHSEYGMTELLSQAYSKSKGIYDPPPWMKALVRDEEDPLTVNKAGTGVLNIIDLANIYSCSFIATDDAGKIYPNGSFEVLGRVDGSDLRGCSLLTV